MKRYLQKQVGGILGLLTYAVAAVIFNAGGMATTANASECYDHWNGDAWHGAAQWAIVLCLDSERMKKCEVRYHNGGKILDLQQHWGLDRGRIIWTNYEVYSFQYPGLLDIVCTAQDDLTYTFTVDNTPNAWWDWGACGPGTDYGGSRCDNDQNEKTLEVTWTDSGKVERSPQGVKCSSGASSSVCYHDPSSQVTLQATPDTGYVFAGWTGGGCSGSGACKVNMNQAQQVSADFRRDTSTVVRSLLLKEKVIK